MANNRNRVLQLNLLQWHAAIDEGDLEQARLLADLGACVTDERGGAAGHGEDRGENVEFTDPLARCCHALCYMAGDGSTHELIASRLAIAHLLIDQGASLWRPDATTDITPLEALLVMEGDDESTLDLSCLRDIARLWARMDENLPAGAAAAKDDATMLARTSQAIPAFERVPRRLVEILEAVSQEKQMQARVDQAGGAAPKPRL